MKKSTEEHARSQETVPSSIPIGRKLSVTISRPKKSHKHDKSTQTVYRESETQTLPWSPDAIFRRRKDGTRIPLELLGVLGDGPLGMDDLILIERARQKHTWENTLPRTSSKTNDTIRLSCITSIAANEVAFRECSLNAECEERLRISKNNLKQDREDMFDRLETRLRNMREGKTKENVQVFQYRERQLRRKMRKLKLDGLKRKDEDGEMDKPGFRIFHDPVRKSRRRKDEMGFSRYLAEFGGVELLEKQIALSSRKFLESPKKPPRRRNICSRAIKRSEKEFEKLRKGKIGKESADVEEEESVPGSRLRKRIRYSYGGKSSLDVAQMEMAEELDQFSLVLGKIVKGRAVQTRLFSGLIELRSRKSK